MQRKVLIILTSHATLGSTGKPTGFYWEELAAPYWAFHDAGHSVGIASVQGGMPPVDPGSDTEDTRTDAVDRFKADETAKRALQDAPAVADVSVTEWDAVFLPGGHGTMWDFSQTPAVTDVVGRIWDRGGVVGAVCHGPAGLIGANILNGDPLVKGRAVTGFSNAEEDKVGLSDVVPYQLETALRGLGADYSCAEPFTAHAVRDGRLVTGQNPQSSEKVAALFNEALAEQAIKVA